jgi:hypothetical protein
MTPKNSPILDETDVAVRMAALKRLQAALRELDIPSVLVGRHRLVLRYNDPSCPPSGLTDPELRIFIAGRQARATTDGACYRLGSRQQFPASDPAAAAAHICRNRPAGPNLPSIPERTLHVRCRDIGPGPCGDD